MMTAAQRAKKTSVHFSAENQKHIKWLMRHKGIKQGAVISMALKELYQREYESRRVKREVDAVSASLRAAAHEMNTDITPR